MLRCGFFETDITPNIGNNVPGYYDPRFAVEILDPLFAHAFAVQGASDPIVIITLDALLLRKSDADRIRIGLSQKLEIPVSNISVAGTHSHTAGPVCEVMDYPADENYCSFMVSRAIDAGYMAHKRMCEAKIGASSCDVHGISFNRRFRLKDGRVKMNPGLLNPDIVESVDIIDPELTVLRIDYADGTPMGMIANYPLHLDTVGKDAYSADYAGVIRRNMKRRYGDDFGFLFMTGTCGNINHFDVSKPRSEQNCTLTIGNTLSDAAGAIFDAVETVDTDIAVCTTDTFIGHQRRPTQEDCDREDNLKNRERMLLVVDLPTKDIEIEVWTAVLGNTAIQMLPGEVFARFGLDLKEKSTNCSHTLIATLSNQSIGYIYTKEAEQQGGYEATPSSYVEMDGDTGYKIVETALSNLHTLQNE